MPTSAKADGQRNDQRNDQRQCLDGYVFHA
jgi:hypothetical protein